MKVPPPHYTKDVPRPRYNSVARAGDVHISTPKGGLGIDLLLQRLEVTIELTDALKVLLLTLQLMESHILLLGLMDS